MKKFLVIGLTALAVFAVASCDLLGGDTPELQVLARANPGEEAGNMGHGNTITFGKPVAPNVVDVVFTIRNTGKADLVLEAPGPDYVVIIEQNEAVKPFSVLVGAATKSIGPGQQVEVTIRFTGTAVDDSTRYTARLRIPSNDPEHPGYFLELEGEGAGV